ncbi:glycerate kinase [Rubritalea tangerina]|uniref:Glycerate kinase n=1 Tax=Rubritalea tangerina TaxID=430798 RepID=A0ABW4Z6M9_9BACT
MKVLVACDKFKGSMTAVEACEAIANGLWEGCPGVEVEQAPIADGGEGFTQAVYDALGGEWVVCETLDAIGRKCEARYLVVGDTAVMEMAAACGLEMIEKELREPEYANTAGVGIMIRDAVNSHGVKRIVLGLGGSATNDAGAGMAVELGAQFYDAGGNPLMPVPAELERAKSADLSQLIRLPEVVVACDVRNPLLGENGASAIYGPQKGVEDVGRMDAILRTIMEVSGGEEVAEVEGAGAAGGLGFGLLHFAGGKLVNGFDWLANELQLAQRIAAVDLVITGEGSLDAQTAEGKGPAGVALMAKASGKPVVAMAGRIEDGAEEAFDRHYALSRLGLPLDECIARGKVLLKNVAREEAEKW